MSRDQAALLVAALSLAACGEQGSDLCAGKGSPGGVESLGASGDSGLGADAAAPSSCLASGPGLTDCGSAKESCCSSLPVAGGTFYRKYTNSGCDPMGEADPATVSSFRLDKYDVTVGRFRQFVNAWNGGWTPAAGSGKHTHLNGGQGLANNGPHSGFEPGWVTADNSNLSLTTANLTSCMGSNLSNDLKLYYYSCKTWTDTPTTQESLPMVCVNWYEAYAFCIWDGGFLPSEAEWEYAAAGGSQQRKYPWGSIDPGNRYAIYNCDYPMFSAVCTDVSKIAPVGTATFGAGRWGQLDLVGNVWQMILDGYAAYYAACTDCVALDFPLDRGARGGAFNSPSGLLLPTYNIGSGARRYDTGVRCARTP
jgi:formylglycine-generating enzyme required for sulfatase activity